jgi:class 3 adenylate cyclase
MAAFSLHSVPPLPTTQFRETTLLVAFADLTTYTATARRLRSQDLAAFVQCHYERSTSLIEGAGGRVVKFIGDAALISFPGDLAETGILTLLEYKRRTDRWLEAIGYPGQLVVKAHVGTVIAGTYGTGPNARFDIIGADVNLTATMESRGFALSAQAFRALGPEGRRHFKKHTPPISYIPLEQAH